MLLRDLANGDCFIFVGLDSIGPQELIRQGQNPTVRPLGKDTRSFNTVEGKTIIFSAPHGSFVVAAGALVEKVNEG